MRNTKIKESQRVMGLVEKLPYFSIDNLLVTGVDRHYLRVLLSRQVQSAKIIRLKRGLYVSQRYIDTMKTKGSISPLLEFFACAMYPPAYLSGEYVMHEYNLLTELPQNFTLMTRNKTARFFNPLGNFIYHSLQERLFVGFISTRENNFTILKASKAKALFDFLYLRKDILRSKKEFDELRLNLDVLSARDKKELSGYITSEGSRKMKRMYSMIK